VSDDNVIHVDFGKAGAVRRRREPLLRVEAPSDDGRPKTRDPFGDLYSFADATRLFGITPGRLRYWDRTGFIRRSVATGGRRFYSFQDLISLRAAKGLLDEGLPLQAVRRSVEALRSSLPQIARPLSSLKIITDGKNVLVRDERGSYEPATGQQCLDFDVSSLHDDVVRVLGRGGTKNTFKRAYELYLEGCRFDEEEGGVERAERAYRQAIELDPSLSNAYTNLGNLLYQRGDLEAARTQYERALEVDPKQPEAHYNLGFLAYESGQLKLALERFEHAIAADPGFADAHFNLALALSDLGKPAQARKHWETYLKLDPKSPWADVARRHLEG